MECGPDNVTAEVVEVCEGVCENGLCDDTRDACPVGEYYGCSDDCEGRNEYCTSDYCPFQGPTAIRPREARPSLVTRIGPYADACSMFCDPDLHAFSFGITESEFPHVRVTVEPPWHITVPQQTLSQALFCGASSVQGCLIIEPESPTATVYFAILSDDPAANARNVTIEGGEDLRCP
jgi:hypothetical protein